MAGRGRPKKTKPSGVQNVTPEDKIKKDGTVTVRVVPTQRIDIRMKWKITNKNGKSWTVLGPIGLVYKAKKEKPGYKGWIDRVEKVK